MVQAVESYKSVTATEEFRNLEWLRMKTAHERWRGVVAEKGAEVKNSANNYPLRAEKGL
ncbi:MAG: hypothetical protein LBE35_04580 [Clostridiales bacterium]|nr:hypothetical protein [Clostridiales bacterium]